MRIWSPKPESNQRQSVYKTAALPTELFGQNFAIGRPQPKAARFVRSAASLSPPVDEAVNAPASVFSTLSGKDGKPERRPRPARDCEGGIPEFLNNEGTRRGGLPGGLSLAGIPMRSTMSIDRPRSKGRFSYSQAQFVSLFAANHLASMDRPAGARTSMTFPCASLARRSV